MLQDSVLFESDVPWYQVPTLGDGDFKGKDIDAEGFWGVPRQFNINYREPENFDLDYKFEGQDFPSWLWRQHPDIFLPEEQGFFDFYGVYPFAVFGAAAMVTTELLPSWANMPNMFLFPVVLVLYLPALEFMSASWMTSWVRRHRNRQARIDREWLGMKEIRHSIDSLIFSYENDMKAKERAEKFDAYNKALNNRKVAFFAHTREKAHAQNLLRRLQAVRAAEQVYSQRVKEDIISGGVAYVSEQFVGRPEVRDSWNNQVFNVVKQHVDAGKVTGHIEDPCQELFNEYLEKTGADIEATAESERDASSGSAIDEAGVQLQESVLKNISDLEVYDGPTEAPKTYVPRATGVFGKVPDSLVKEKRDLVKIASRQLEVVQKQLARFKPDRQPESLVKKLAEAQQKLAAAQSA